MTVLKVDFSSVKGEIRKLNGVCLSPRLYGSAKGDNNSPFKALNSPVARFHDAPLDNPGMRLVDPHLIFANFHADAGDPDNYYFRQTDDYLRNCRDLGTDIHYRLGPSIEHSKEKYFIYPPEDPEKWVQICSNIIRHYNEGWNNGFNWDVRYWTIWEEPENKRLWNGEPIQFFRFFKLAVNLLKERFPQIKLGTVIGNHLPEPWFTDFLTYCRDEKVSMDFLGWSCYKGDLEQVISWPAKIRTLIDSYGFTGTELHVAEWNYTNREKKFGYSGRNANEHPEGCYGYVAAAFAAAVLTGWQDTPLTMANYYTASTVMGLFDRYGEPKKNYYGLLAFGEMTKFDRRVAACSGSDEIKVLAGLNKDNEGAVLVSAFRSPERKLELEIKAAQTSSLEVLCVNPELNLEKVDFKHDAGRIVLDNSSGCCVFLIKGVKAKQENQND